MKWVIWGLAAAAIAASTFSMPDMKVRGDYYGWQEPILNEEAGDSTLTLCKTGEASC